MSRSSGASRQWRVRASALSRNTHNPIREIIEELKLKPNPDKSIIPLSVGDPTCFGNLKPPKEMIDVIHECLERNESRSYAPVIGHFKARKAVAEYCKLKDVTADDVILSSGCAHAIELVISTLAEAGNNILVPRPGYAVHKTIGEGLGIEIRYYELLPKDNWKINLHSLESQIDVNTAAIVINNPSNPCGSVYSKEHLLEVLDIASRNCVPIIADEIYEGFVFSDQEFVPMAALSKDVPVLTCSGLTKRYLVPGWRFGWVIISDRNNLLDKEVRKALYNMCSRILGANTLVQEALPKILDFASHSYFKDMMKFIESQAQYAYKELMKAPGLRPVMPQGSMYMMIEIKMSLFPKFVNELHFIKDLFAEYSVLCIPGQCFNNYGGYMRIVLTVPEDILKEACTRIITFCENHIVYENNTNDLKNDFKIQYSLPSVQTMASRISCNQKA